MSRHVSRRLIGAVALAGAFALVIPAAVSAQEEDGSRRYMVQFRARGPHAAVVRDAGGAPVEEVPDLGIVAAWLTEPQVQRLARNPGVLTVEVDPPRYPMAQSSPYGVAMIQADQVSDAAAANRKICIIDSGYYMGHEDLPHSGVTASFNAATGDPFRDFCGHGTHVAGTIAAVNNAIGVTGVLPNQQVNLHIVKVFGDDCAWAYSSDLIHALQECRANGANVVSMSLGGDEKSVLEESAFNSAWNAGLISVGAAGNDGDTAYAYPGSYDSVVSVAAVNSSKAVASFSQKNDQVDLAAPGVGVLSTVPFKETSTVAIGATAVEGTWIENAARTAAEGVAGALASGGLCDSVDVSWSGKVVLCQRGTITFQVKVQNVQSAGGIAAVIANNAPGNFNGTLGAGNSSTIPAISISQADGQALGGRLGSSASVVSFSEKPANGYDSWSGTSMATPHVAAVAALVWSQNPNWTNGQVLHALEASAEDLGDPGRDDSYGWGLVQAKAAVEYLNAGGVGNTDTTAPFVSDVTSRRIGKNVEIAWTTNEPSSSVVQLTGGLSVTLTGAGLVTNHRLTFHGPKKTLYTYSVSSTDAAGNTATSGPYTYQN
ncbi:MAG TPA: S8 family serine peptidase [Thermoanaerobaculia bacterium]|jgi:subtilisin family serine protease|nr:S8 family serine peptidase [Thermoanaerobaculia bacterium]HEV8611571.1 S8 family serine peptidase [Thermoanaerobaculia bacterium]